MKKTSLIALSLAVASTNAINLRSQSKTDPAGTFNNQNYKCFGDDLIVNGGFEEPKISGSWTILSQPSINGWTSSNNQFEIGHGYTYFTNWVPQDTQAVELDGNTNYAITQKINLTKSQASGGCQLQFEFGSRTGDDSSDMTVKFNGGSFKIHYNDKLQRRFFVYVAAKEGENVLTFEGAGPSNSYGAVLDNVKLNCNCIALTTESPDC